MRQWFDVQKINAVATKSIGFVLRFATLSGNEIERGGREREKKEQEWHTGRKRIGSKEQAHLGI